MTDTLKSICEQCGNIVNPQLDFIPQRLNLYRTIIERDLKQLVFAASLEMDKAVVLLAGSIFEAVLHSFIQAHAIDIEIDRAGVPFKFDPESRLQKCVHIMKVYFARKIQNLDLLDSMARDRNLVHINQEISKDPDACYRASREMIRQLNLLLMDLANYSRRP